MKVFLTGRLHDFAMRDLRSRYEVDVHTGRIPVSRRVLRSKIRDADGLVCFPFDRIDREIIDSAENLRTICAYSVGFDHIDVEHAKSRKIRVGYTPDVLTDATADLAFSLILDVARRVTEGDRAIRAGRWKTGYGPYDFLGMDLRSKTLGILGMGRIGQAVAGRAVGFGMKIAYHSRRRIPASRERALGARYFSLPGLVSRSDVISIHVPYTAETHRMVDAAFLGKMKRTAILVNTARGRIVNQSDLAQALKKKVIAGAGLDVFESEPVPRGDPLARLQNAVLAPHIGSSTVETREAMARLTLRNLHLGMAGRKPVCSVGY